MKNFFVFIALLLCSAERASAQMEPAHAVSGLNEPLAAIGDTLVANGTFFIVRSANNELLYAEEVISRVLTAVAVLEVTPDKSGRGNLYLDDEPVIGNIISTYRLTSIEWTEPVSSIFRRPKNQ